MPNLIAVSNLVAQSTTEFFEQGSPLLNTANRMFQQQFQQNAYMTGGSIDVKIPGTPEVQDGLVVTASDIQDLTVPYVITENDIHSVTRNLNLFEQMFDIRGEDKALTKDQKKAVVDNYAYPAFQALEGKLETIAALRLKTSAFYTPIDTIDKLGSVNTYSTVSQVNTMFNLLKLQKNDRYMMMNELDAKLVEDSLQNMFNTMINTKITRDARIGSGEKGRLANMDLYRSPELLTHTAGALASTQITVASVAADGSTITFSGVTHTSSKLINAGDRISIPSVFLVCQITQQVLPFALVVTAAADANGDGAGNVTVTLSFPLLASGEHTNVNAIPSVSAAAFVYPSRRLNFAYVPSGLSAVPLKLGDVYGAINSNYNSGYKVPVKVIQQGAVLQLSNNFRILVMCGIKAFAPYCIELPSLA